MSNLDFPPFLLTDWYKISHRPQYKPGTSHVFATWIPRGSRMEGVNEVVSFGFQAFIQHYMVDYFQRNFFDRDLDEVLEEYTRVVKYCLGDQNPDASHLAYLHGLGYLPILIKAVPEGTKMPLRVPMLTIENTDPQCFWLTNALETLFSCSSWLPSTSATIAHEFRKCLDYWCAKTGGDPNFVPLQGHDFSMRGMSSVESSVLSGMGHLLSFIGTDNIPGIMGAESFYGANIENEVVGVSVAATEHAVMCVYGRDELASYRRLLTEVYPSGILSIVSDTWDLFVVLTQVLPALKDDIMARDGTCVIRPDSGDPADIICGLPISMPQTTVEQAQQWGVVETLWILFGGTVNDKGYKVLDSHIGAIYGDAINLSTANEICSRLEAKGFCSTNIVFGIGSYSYQLQTRDTFNFALKSTWAMVDGEEINIYKDPATDKEHMKKSLTGRVFVHRDEDGEPSVIDGLNLAGEAKLTLQGKSMLQTIFIDGEMQNPTTFSEIRERVAS